MDETEALDFRLNATRTEPNCCQSCGTETQFLLCSDCLFKGARPTYRVDECVSCGKRTLNEWDAPGTVTCGQTSCYIGAVDRMASYLISV